MMKSIKQVWFNVSRKLITLQMGLFILLLQRMPALRSLVEVEFSSAPKVMHLFKWVVGTSVFVGSINTVTAASDSIELIEGMDNTTGYVGEDFQISFWAPDQGVNPKAYEVTSPTIPGLSLDPVVTEYGVGTISGVPTQVGVYNVDIWAYEEEDKSGDSILFALTIYVRERGASISQQPQSQNLNWGELLYLSVSVPDSQNASYQWYLDDVAIEGETGRMYEIAEAFATDEGVYRVDITKDNLTTQSNTASITVSSTSTQRWREISFMDPFSTDALSGADPDKDGVINLMEYSVGADPQKANTLTYPIVSREIEQGGTTYMVYTLPKNPVADDVIFTCEFSNFLVSGTWNEIRDQIAGMQLTETATEIVVKVPLREKVFVRFLVQ